MNFDEPRSILHVCVHGRPTAVLAVAHNADFLLDYLPDAQEDVSPVLPRRKEPYQFDHLPVFLSCLLPRDGRSVQVAKQLGFDVDDALSRVRHCLASENIGHITVIPSIETLAVSKGGFSLDGLSAMTPAPVVMTAGSVDVLNDPDIQKALPQELIKKGGCTGVGGQFAKGFLRTSSADYLIKHYNDFPAATGEEIANMEAASMQAANYCGVPAAEARSFGTMLCSLRFDRPGARKVSHARELTQDKDLYDGSNEKMLGLVAEYACQDTVRFAKQVMFAWVLGDSDKHQENIAFVEDDGIRTLAPLYDSLPSRFVSGDVEETALPICGKKSKLSWKNISGFAADAGMSAEETSKFINNAVHAVRNIVLPACPRGIRDSLTTHLVVAEKTALRVPRQDIERELAKELMKKNEPEVLLSPGRPLSRPISPGPSSAHCL